MILFFLPLFRFVRLLPLFVAEKNHWKLYIRISYQHHKQYSVFSFVLLLSIWYMKHEDELDAMKWLAHFIFSSVLLNGNFFFICCYHYDPFYMWHIVIIFISIIIRYSLYVKIYQFGFGFTFTYLNVLTPALNDAA